jgi:hypothetical protein
MTRPLLWSLPTVGSISPSESRLHPMIWFGLIWSSLVVPSSTHTPTVYPSIPIQAQFGLDADELWWPGTVRKLRKGGCVDIAYDDGDFEKRKPLARVRPLR